MSTPEAEKVHAQFVAEVLPLEQSVRWREIKVLTKPDGFRMFHGAVGAWHIMVCREVDGKIGGTARDDITNEMVAISSHMAQLLWGCAEAKYPLAKEP